MCGIAGLWTGTGDEPAEGEVTVAAMTAALAHRGPDTAGHARTGNVWFGARRLSIVDLDAGAQPVRNENGTLHVIFNGEIYNHAELRTRLSRAGHIFATRCDTEVIVHLYEEYGERCVRHLRGMFALAITDGERLFLARDRLGIKPLYYTVIGQSLLFASEIKALLRHPDLRAELDLQAFADDLLIGTTTEGRTFFEGVRELPPAHTLTVGPGPAGPALTVRRYDQLPDRVDRSYGFQDAQAELLARLRESVRLHLAADVEIGVLLSGGLDSTVLAMLAHEVDSGPRRSFAVADSADHPDLVQSRRVADSLGWSHRTHVLTFTDYVRALPGYAAAMERPGRTGAIPIHVLYGRVGAELKVGLIGEGADELFGGYAEYLDPSLYSRSIFDARLARLERLGVSPSTRAGDVVTALSAARSRGDYLAALFDTNLRERLVHDHLDVHDKLGMRHGLELRVPYLDEAVVDVALRMPAEYRVRGDLGVSKHILKHVAVRTWGDNGPLVDSVLRGKIGAPSAGLRFQRVLAEICEARLPDDYLTRHELGFCFRYKFQLLLHELFCEIFLVRRGDADGLSLREFALPRVHPRGAVPV